jgi:hypothetical protein
VQNSILSVKNDGENERKLKSLEYRYEQDMALKDAKIRQF